LNRDVALSNTSNTSTPAAGAPSAATTPSFRPSERRISRGRNRAPVVTSKSIGVVHAMQLREHRHGVKHDMLQIDREIENYDRDEDLRPDGKERIIEETPAALLAKRGHADRGEREGEVQNNGIERDNAEIPGPACPTRQGAAPPRRQRLRRGHDGQYGAEHHQPDDRLIARTTFDIRSACNGARGLERSARAIIKYIC
jgi:hypothetical protein